MSARLIQVIVTDFEMRGEGIANDPIRRITQYWSLDGELLAEVDPITSRFGPPGPPVEHP